MNFTITYTTHNYLAKPLFSQFQNLIHFQSIAIPFTFHHGIGLKCLRVCFYCIAPDLLRIHLCLMRRSRLVFLIL